MREKMKKSVLKVGNVRAASFVRDRIADTKIAPARGAAAPPKPI